MVFCFGELLLRLSPQLNGEWIRQSSMPVYFGGAELNVATALATWGLHVKFCTSLPDNHISREIISRLKEKNIDTSPVFFSGNRIGNYFLLQTTGQKNEVIYDREHSSFSAIQPGQIDWPSVLQDVNWFHFSAINPAINENVARVNAEALQAASSMGITISMDLNYRPRLWQYNKQPHEVVPELASYCDVIMGNIWAAEKMLGISINNDLKDKQSMLGQAEETSRIIFSKYEKCRQVANTFRFDESSGARYYATLMNNNGFHVSAEHHSKQISEKVGSGDTFMAALIYGDHKQMNAQEKVDFAAAAAFNKLFIKGDSTTSTVEEIRRSYK